jgi:hypothetical protein
VQEFHSKKLFCLFFDLYLPTSKIQSLSEAKPPTSFDEVIKLSVVSSLTIKPICFKKEV